MSFLQIKSTNPDFSYLLQKNPASGMLIKTFRHGHFFGYYSKDDTSTYNVYFKDGDDEVSIKKSAEDEVDYLNVSRYNSATFVYSAIRDYFSHLENNQYSDSGKDVDGFTHTITINLVFVEIPRYLQFFNESFKGFDLTYEEITPKNFRIVITSTKSLSSLINYLSLLSLFLVMLNETEYLFADEMLTKRFLNVLNRLEANYYIRYLFKVKILGNKEKLFNKFKKELEGPENLKINMVLGDTHVQRIGFVEKNLTLKSPIVDVGCGEGRHTIPLAKKIQDQTIFAIDISDEARKELEFRLKRQNITNVKIFEDIEAAISTAIHTLSSRAEVVCSEVIEHLEVQDVEPFLRKMFQIPGNRYIITTPNRDFNKYYETLTGFRNKDHKFEFNEIEFRNYMIDFISKYKLTEHYNFEFKGVGDSVNGTHLTQAIILTLKSC